MDETVVERIIRLMEYYGLSPSVFADKIDVQRSSMSHLVSGRNKPSLDFIQKILNQFSDINPTWLIMGTGPMKQLALFDDSGDPATPVPLPVFTETPSKLDTASIQQEIVQKAEKQLFDRPEDSSIQEPPISPKQPIVPHTEKVPFVSPIPSSGTNQTVSTNFSPEKTPPIDKKVTKIVFFYSDKTFEAFNPQ